jgi:hypothetical protein
MELLDLNSEEIWNFVYPTTLGAMESWDLGDPGRQRKYMVLEGECGWEKEHGILMSWRDGRELVKVSDYDGHATNGHAFDDPQKDRWIYYSLRDDMCTKSNASFTIHEADESEWEQSNQVKTSWLARLKRRFFQ